MMDKLVLAASVGVALLAYAPTTSFDSPYVLKVAPEHKVEFLDAGLPGFDGAGNVCVRSGAKMLVATASARAEALDFGAAAAAAINRDLMKDAKWDGKWDQSLMVDTSIVFDAGGKAYTLLIPRYSNLANAALLWSVDHCRSWHAARLVGRNATMEKPGSLTNRDRPPTVLSYENYGGMNGSRLWLDLFHWDGGRLIGSPSPNLVADDSGMVANHSGGGNPTFTGQHRLFVVYPTIDKSRPGSETVARQFDLDSGRWLTPAEPVARSRTQLSADPHDLPSIAPTPSGRLLVVIGAHHSIFQTVTSKEPNTITAGWSAPEVVGDPTQGPIYQQYSYVSLNVSRTGTINILARAEGDGGHYDLVQLRKTANGKWTDWPNGLPQQIIAVPRRTAYAAWRQRVTEAPDGALYLNFAYFPNRLTAAEATVLHLKTPAAKDCDGDRCWYADSPTLASRTLVSHDDGLTWR